MNPNVPFRTIYINDASNMDLCTSPFHPKGASAGRRDVFETVKEAAPYTDVQFIQLAYGQVPWYHSKIYSYQEHLKWWSEFFEVPFERFGELTGLHAYMRDGGDVLQDFIDACRAHGQAAFVSLRLNDEHYVEWIDRKGHMNGLGSICRFVAEHRHLMFGSDLSVWENRSLNWINPAVPQHILDIATEQCELYDIDGFDLDFMRFPKMFDPAATTFEQRREIMEGFVRNVRDVLDRTAHSGRHRYLCVRLSADLAKWDELGLAPERLKELGVEMVTISSHYHTNQWIDFEAFTRRMPDLAVYFEATHCTAIGRLLDDSSYDNFIFRRTTPAEFYSTALLARRAGAQGMSYFNFAYYREHGTDGRGPFREPPFDAIGRSADPEFLDHAPQHFFVARNWFLNPLKENAKKDVPCGFSLYMQPPAGGWQTDLRLRIKTEQPLGDCRFTLVFNGVECAPTDDISEPYEEDNGYPGLHGSEENSLAWIVPARAAVPGKNAGVLTYGSDSGIGEVCIEYIDIFPDKT